MQESMPADLKAGSGIYYSKRPSWDVLFGEDKARPVKNATISGDIATLQDLLSQPEWIKIVLESQYIIHSADNENVDQLGQVMARQMTNLHRAVIVACLHGQPAALSALLDFAKNQQVEPSTLVTFEAVNRALRPGRRPCAELMDVLASADSGVFNRRSGHTLPLEWCLRYHMRDTVAVLLKHGVDVTPKATRVREGSDEDPNPRYRNPRCWSYPSSLLAQASDTHMTEMLLAHGVPVARTGAFHYAAELGHLDKMRVLIDHGADVNERLLAESFPPFRKRELLSTWTPMHYAASNMKEEAMEALEKCGVLFDVEDVDGRMPKEVLEQARQGRVKRAHDQDSRVDRRMSNDGH